MSGDRKVAAILAVEVGGIAALISARGDAMEGTSNVKILFVAGFGPIVRDTGESRKLYGEVLGIAFKEESDSYLHTEMLQGAKTFALWPLSQAAQSCFGKDSWPDDIPAPQAWLSLTLTASTKQRRSLNREDIPAAKRTRCLQG